MRAIGSQLLAISLQYPQSDAPSLRTDRFHFQITTFSNFQILLLLLPAFQQAVA